jgi:hypothetical protein
MPSFASVRRASHGSLSATEEGGESIGFPGRPSRAAVAGELGMRVRGRRQAPEPYWHADICALIARLLEVMGHLGPADRKIVEAICRHGNLRAAARSLAPGQPYYRTFLQRKTKAYRETLARLASDPQLSALFPKVMPE